MYAKVLQDIKTKHAHVLMGQPPVPEPSIKQDPMPVGENKGRPKRVVKEKVTAITIPVPKKRMKVNVPPAAPEALPPALVPKAPLPKPSRGKAPVLKAPVTKVPVTKAPAAKALVPKASVTADEIQTMIRSQLQDLQTIFKAPPVQPVTAHSESPSAFWAEDKSRCLDLQYKLKTQKSNTIKERDDETLSAN